MEHASPPAHCPVAEAHPHTSLQDTLRRLLDILAATGILVLSFPLIALTAAWIRSGSPGPVLFRQKRLGLGAKPFTFYKFRTLYADAKERFPELYAYRFTGDELETRTFKVASDPRVTPQGRWLRRTSIDELPNLWNVLKGDMTLVGPRPEIPEMLPYYHGEMLDVFSVRPGVTGAAQVLGRGDLSIAEAIRADVSYLRRRTLFSDVTILLRTFLVVFRREGAY